MIPLSGGILIENHGGVPRLLLGRRAVTRRFYPGVWDAIGGHIEPGETAERALARELREEIGVTPLTWREVRHLVVPTPHDGPEAVGFDFWLYAVTAWEGTPRNLQPEEHDDISWFGIAEACGLDLAFPDYPSLFREMGDMVG